MSDGHVDVGLTEIKFESVDQTNVPPDLVIEGIGLATATGTAGFERDTRSRVAVKHDQKRTSGAHLH
ncbi:hypothetical protein DVH05_009252 [Phytophthora capsici]|nr:hypothetical protein DVH05_009252 [Phytophthora capsici]